MQRSIRRQFYGCVASALTPISLGLLYGYTSQAIPSLAADSSMPLSTDDLTWVGSLPPLMAVLTTALSAPMSASLGRRTTMMLVSLPAFLAWLAVGFGGGLSALLVGRGVAGVAAAIGIPAAYTFVSEIADDKHRGLFGSFLSVGFNCGILGSYIIGCFFEWRGAALTSSVIPLLQFVLLLGTTTSPRWQALRGRPTNAIESLAWYRDEDILNDEVKSQLEQEVSDMRKSEGKSDIISRIQLLFSPDGRLRLLTCLSISFFLMMTGYTIINFHAKSLLLAGGVIHPDGSSVLIGVTQVVSNIVSAFLVDSLGRRLLLAVSSGLIAVSQLGLAVILYVESVGGTAGGDWMTVLILMVFNIAFPIGWGSIPHLLVPELVPTSTRTETIVTCNMWEQFLQFSVLQVHSRSGSLMPLVHGSFSLISILSLPFLYFLPETAGKSLEQIQQDMENLGLTKDDVMEKNGEKTTLEITNRGYKTMDE